MKGILDGIRVLDLARFVAGPYCCQLLGDMGADVIKVESIKGDDGRTMLPALGDISTYFIINNRNKRSITLNFKDPKGKEILKKLVKTADVLVENFRPGVMERLGIGYDVLKEINPGLIMVSISGFGQDGPYSRRPAFDSVIQAMGGLMDLTGDNNPVVCGTWVGDYSSGLMAAYGTALALLHRKETGKGQHLDIALLDCIYSWIRTSVPDYELFGKRHHRQGARDLYRCPVGIFPTKNGYIYITATTQNQYESLVTALGHPEWRTDSRFLAEKDRLKHSTELTALLNEETKRFDTEELYELLVSEDVPCSPVNNVEQVLKNPQLAHRGQFRHVKIHSGEEVPVSAPVIKFSDTPGDIRLPPPGIGEHNNEIYLYELGISKETLEELKQEGVI